MKTYTTRSLLVGVTLVACLLAVIVPALQTAREAAIETTCSNNLKQIGLALLNYHDTYHHLPIASECTTSGRRWGSWRAQVYPYMMQTPQVYDHSKAWDSAANLRLINGTPIPMTTEKGGGTTVMVTLERTPPSFSCPKCKACNGVNYVVVTGEGTAFPRSASIQWSDITDGPENTILVVESTTCTPDWTEPRDLDLASMAFKINSQDKPSISSRHASGALVCFADGEVFCLTPSVTAAELKAMLTIAGGEDVTRDDLLARGVLLKR